MEVTTISHGCSPAAQARAYAAAHDLDYNDLIDTILHRTWCLDPAGFDKVLAESGGNLLWHIEHAKSIEEQNYTGSKYNPELENMEIAKLLRKEIKEQFPDVQVSVRCRRASFCKNISITVMAAPFVLRNADRFRTEEAEALIEKIKVLANEYNFDHGDAMTDYTHNNFFLTVDLDWRT